MMRLVICAILCLWSAATADCPGKCRCNKYKSFCWNSGLNGLPHGLESSTLFVKVQSDNITELNQNIISQALPTGLKELHLVNIFLQRIKTSTFQNIRLLESLVITGNNINILVKGAFKYLHMLYKLDLSQNGISVVELGAFDGLASLRHLNMSYNKIKILQEGIFNGVNSAGRFNLLAFRSMLDLSFNKIDHIEPGVFKNLSSFARLNLNGCNAVPYLPGMFKGLIGLKILDMTNLFSFRNNYTSLTKDVMQDISNLIILNFKNSGIVNIEMLAFRGFNLLSQLDLSLNFIFTLRNGAFFGLSSLKVLTLRGNAITSLNKDVFEGLRSLTILDLGQCNIRVIYSDAFRGLFKLRYLDLGKNNISTLTRYAFSDLVMVREIILRGNSLMSFDALNRVFSLKYLDLQNTGSNNITKEIFQSLPRLDNLKITNVESINGQQVLRSLDIHVTMDTEQVVTVKDLLHRILRGVKYLQEFKLTLSGISRTSQIGDISKFQFSFIEIYNSTLALFIENSFKNQTSLKSLKISHCDIITIQVGAFYELTSLPYLDLSYNSRIELREGMFLGLNNLKQLNISFSELDKLEVGGFFGLDSLQLLDISGNEITTLDAKIFEGLDIINTLNISQNSIYTLKQGVFGATCGENFTDSCDMSYISAKNCNKSNALITLRILDLSHNEISYIHPHTFAYCSNLQALDLSYNEMLNLDINFLQIPNLRILNLSNCNINSVPIEVFRCTTKLSDIQLSFNKIKNLNIIKSLGRLSNLKTLNLSGNPMTCDCQHQEMSQWLHDRYSVNGRNGRSYFPGYSICNHDIGEAPSMQECKLSIPVYKDLRQYNTYHVTFFNRNIQHIILIMIFVSGFLGNSLLIYAILGNSELRTFPNICILSLAVAHLLFVILYLPLAFWDIFHYTWKSNLTTCKLLIVIKDLVLGITIFAILVMSVQRFLVFFPLRKSTLQCQLYQNNLTILLNLLAWVLAIGISIPVYLPFKYEIICLNLSSGNNENIKIIAMSQLIIYCIIPVSAIVFLEVYIVLLENGNKLLVESLGIPKVNERKHYLNMTLILVFVFIVSYFPSLLTKVLIAWSIVDTNMQFLPTLSSYLFFSNSVLNPVVLFAMSPKYKYTIM